MLIDSLFLPLSNLIDGRPKRTLYSKKYGVDLIRYTHAANTVVYSSNKIDGMLMHEYLLLVFVCSMRKFQFELQVKILLYHISNNSSRNQIFL